MSENSSLCAAKKPLEVVGALIEDSDTYLVGQRAASKSQGGFWEFIGGKIEADETPEQALARECREELSLDIENAHVIDAIVHTYPEKTIRLTLVACTPKAGSIPICKEHQALRWVTLEEMAALNFAEADRKLLAHLLRSGAAHDAVS